MTVLGVLLLLVGIGTAVDVVLENGNAIDATLFGQTITNVRVGSLVLLGVAAGVVALLGISMFGAGLRRGHELRRERQSLRRQVQSSQVSPTSVTLPRERDAAPVREQRTSDEEAPAPSRP